MSERTRLTVQNPASRTLVSVVPFSVMRQFGLTEYDELEWLVVSENGELIVRVKPVKAEKKNEA